MSNTLKIFSKDEIIEYLEFEKKRIEMGKRFNGSITAISPNLNKDATESLGCHLINSGEILSQLKPVTSIERFSNKDIVVNKHHKLEVKATSSSDGTVTPSDSNFDSFAWIWLDMRPYFHEYEYIIPIHVITNPKCCITTTRYVKTLKQNKVTIKSVIQDAVTTGNYYRNDFNLEIMKISRDGRVKISDDLSTKFFGVN